MWENNDFLKQEMQQVEEYLSKALKTKSKIVENALKEFLKSGGKRLRPVLTILGAAFGTYKRDAVIPVACAMEIIHMATLIHDDIIDDAQFRRGKETMQAALGKNTAVYCGDFLFTRAFKVIADQAEVDMMKHISKGVEFICDSEIAQNEQRYDRTVTVKKYLKRIGGKTAALFALSLASGAYKGGCPDKLVKKLGKIGKDIGMAFQLVDDILDYTGDEKTVGKPLLNDAIQGVYTLPIIYGLNSSYKEEVEEALNRITEDKGQSLLAALQKCGGIEDTKTLARKYIKKAIKATEGLPEGIGKHTILNIIELQLERKF